MMLWVGEFEQEETKVTKENKCRVVAQLAALRARLLGLHWQVNRKFFSFDPQCKSTAFIPGTSIISVDRCLLVVCFIQSSGFVSFVTLPFAALTAAQPLLRVQPVARPVGSLRCSNQSG